jgi:molybdate/tungstate transport system permease protein
MSLQTNLKRVKRHPLTLLFSIIGSVLLLFTMVTLLNMLFKQMLRDPYGLVEVLLDPKVIDSIILTMYASLLATLIAAIFGTPLAYVLARHNFRGKSLIEAFVDIPVIIPHSVAGIALYALLMRRSTVGSVFSQIGIVFEDSLWGVVAAMLFVSTPFYMNTAREGFQSVDPRLENVARTLGASRWNAFYKISLPLALRHLFSGALMAWARGISEFGAVIFIAFYPMIAPTLIYYRFYSYGLRYSQPIAVFLIIICLVVFIGLRLLTKYWGRYYDRT